MNDTWVAQKSMFYPISVNRIKGRISHRSNRWYQHLDKKCYATGRQAAAACELLFCFDSKLPWGTLKYAPLVVLAIIPWLPSPWKVEVQPSKQQSKGSSIFWYDALRVNVIVNQYPPSFICGRRLVSSLAVSNKTPPSWNLLNYADSD